MTDLKIFQGGQTNREYINAFMVAVNTNNFYLSHFHLLMVKVMDQILLVQQMQQLENGK